MADQAVPTVPIKISRIEMIKLIPLDSGHRSENHLSVRIDKVTNMPVKTAKITKPTGVRSVLVFLVAVAA